MQDTGRGAAVSVRRVPRRGAVTAPLLGETRRSGEAYNDYANYIVFRILVFIFGFSWPFRRTFYEVSANLP